MLYGIIWFIVACLLIGFGVYFDVAMDDEYGCGYIALSLLWPLVIPFAIVITAGYFFAWFLMRCYNGRKSKKGSKRKK